MTCCSLKFYEQQVNIIMEAFKKTVKPKQDIKRDFLQYIQKLYRHFLLLLSSTQYLESQDFLCVLFQILVVFLTFGHYYSNAKNADVEGYKFTLEILNITLAPMGQSAESYNFPWMSSG